MPASGHFVTQEIGLIAAKRHRRGGLDASVFQDHLRLLLGRAASFAPLVHSCGSLQSGHLRRSSDCADSQKRSSFRVLGMSSPEPKIKVAIVEDGQEQREALRFLIGASPRFACVAACVSVEEALEFPRRDGLDAVVVCARRRRHQDIDRPISHSFTTLLSRAGRVTHLKEQLASQGNRPILPVVQRAI